MTVALKREMFSSLRTGSILSLQGGILLPTGDSKRGFGAGTTQFEPFGVFDQMVKENTFLQPQLGADLPVDTSIAPRSMFWRVAVGQAMAPDHMLGRLFSPMVEFLAVRDFKPGASTNWDVLPEMQITVSRRQHVRIGFGVRQAIEDECSICHMPAVRLADRDAGRHTPVLSRLPLRKFPKGDRAAADGVTCSVCHQIEKTGLGTEATFVGNVVFAKPVQNDERPEYGPFEIDKGHQTVMHSSTATYFPTRGDHMRESGLCGSCHTLYTAALGPKGEKIAQFPEQVPFQEWQHSDYATKQTCQDCHMPVVNEAVAVTALYSPPREGVHRHVVCVS